MSMQGIIDVGSNTIRLVIYETAGEIRQVLNTADYAGLLAHVQGGNLDQEGVDKLVGALSAMKGICEEYGCEEIYAFATASLRDIRDQAGLCALVEQKTGVPLEIISGEREAEYDYLGLRVEYRTQTGAAFDLGGGSCQLIAYEQGRVTAHTSMPIGSLRLYKAYVRGTLPEEAEREAIRARVKQALEGFPPSPLERDALLYAMGGASRAALEMKRSLRKDPDCDSLTIAEIKELAGLPEQVLQALVPQRLTTMVPALITIEELCRNRNAAGIRVVDCGVREGILYQRMEKKATRCCIFDLDGTLTNTLESIAYFGNKALAQIGLPPIDTEEYRYLVGDGRDVLIHRMLRRFGRDTQALFQEAGACYDREYAADFLHLTTVYPGIRELLTALKAQGIRLAVLSNKPDDMTRRVVSSLFEEDCFDHVQGKLPGVACKPDPESALAVAEKLGVLPEQCLFIGDTNVDIHTGKNAGMHTAGVLWGFRDEQELREAGAEHLVSAAGELLELI